MFSFLVFLNIIKIKYEKDRVTIARIFSKSVFAKIFPIVFKPNRIRNTHKMIFITFIGMKAGSRSSFINKTKPRKILNIIEIVSNTYISESFSNLPPHVIS